MPGTAYNFGDFELDAARFELLRKGRPVKLERIPMELLILLVQRGGNLVTRKEITEKLWGQDVNVDTVHGINTAIRKIRQALKDDPEHPRFIETVTGKGYRLAIQQNGTQPSTQPRLEPQLSSSAHAAAVQSAPAPESAPQPASRRWWPPTALSLVLVAVSMIILAFTNSAFRSRFFHPSPPAPIRSIAVLPLANLSGDPSQDYFADGVTDELITALAQNRSLRIISRTTVMQYKGIRKPTPEIARELGVDGILEGSVERSPTRMHLNVQLVYGPTDTHLWAQSYDRDLKEAFSLPAELSRTIAKEVNTATATITPPRYIAPDAHDAYLRGRFLWFAGNYERSQEFFEKAIQIQPDYAAAWAGFSDSFIARAAAGRLPAPQIAAKASAAAQKSVQLDDSLSEAHNTMAAVCFFLKWDLPCAQAEISRAIELNPNFAEAHHLNSYILTVLNRPAEAIQEQKRASEIDPFARPWALGYAYLHNRQDDAAINELRLRAEAQPENVLIHYMLAQAYRNKGMDHDSAREFERACLIGVDKAAADEVRSTFADRGQKGIFEWRIQRLTAAARKGYVSPYYIATAYAGLGRKPEALRYLDDAFNERTPMLVFLQNEPDLNILHSDEHFRALVKKLGLPTAQ